MLRRSVGLVAAVVLLASAAAGCGAAGQANPEKIGPRGVDELVIPTPSPDPEDFVSEVDNPWLPLAPGTVWTYDVSGGAADELEVRVEDRRETVAGVECVVVRSRLVGSDVRTVGVSRFYAQDRAGNVWLLGERPDVEGVDAGRSWLAGEDGAEAGIAMLATPRVGDGYLQERATSAQDRSTVLAVDEERTGPAGTFRGLLLTEDTLSGLTDVVVHRYYAEGVGLVEETTTVGGSSRYVLASVVEPP